MVFVRKSRGWSRIASGVVSLTLTLAWANEAVAQSRLNKLAAPLASEDFVLAQVARPPTARFFTINEVLARQGLQNAALGRAPSLQSNEKIVDSDTATIAGPEPFGLFGFRAPNGRLWANWRAIQAQLGNDLASIADCRARPASCTEAAAHFVSLLEEAEKKSGRARIETINRLGNKSIRYMSDTQQHGEPDRWSSPLTSLTSGNGDCEDYAILKYAMLRMAGFASEDLRIVLVRNSAGRQDHAVLAARDNKQWLILDNQRAVTLTAEELPTYKALYSLGHGGVTLLATRFASIDGAGLDSAELAPATSNWGRNEIQVEETAGASQYAALLL